MDPRQSFIMDRIGVKSKYSSMNYKNTYAKSQAKNGNFKASLSFYLDILKVSNAKSWWISGKHQKWWDNVEEI